MQSILKIFVDHVVRNINLKLCNINSNTGKYNSSSSEKTNFFIHTIVKKINNARRRRLYKRNMK